MAQGQSSGDGAQVLAQRCRGLVARSGIFLQAMHDDGRGGVGQGGRGVARIRDLMVEMRRDRGPGGGLGIGGAPDDEGVQAGAEGIDVGTGVQVAVETFGVGGNSNFDCIAGTPCSPSTQFNDRYTLRVTMVWQYGLYENDIPLEVGGTVLIRMATRPWTNQPDIHLSSRDTFGAFIDETYPNFGEYDATTRNVQFIGTADCQYFHHFCCNDQDEEAGSPQPPFGVPSEYNCSGCRPTGVSKRQCCSPARS